jgi:cyclohexyl-isocyanide hydratase
MGIDPGVTHRIVGTEARITDEAGFRFEPDAVYEDLSGFDLLVVPGGLGTRKLIGDPRCLDYLRSWGSERPIASVCSGALLLGHAGHLEGLRATTHHLVVDDLRPLCAEVMLGQRIVDEGRVITAAGVSSAIDLGLYLVEKFWGTAARERIAAQMEVRSYSPQ